MSAGLNVAVLVLLGVTAAVLGLLLTARGERLRPPGARSC